MKSAKLVLVLLVTMGLIVFVRGGRDFSLPKALPFCGGHKPGFYDFGALCLIVLMLWGLGRLRRTGDEPAEKQEVVEVQEADSDADDTPEEHGQDADEDQEQDPRQSP